MGLSPPIMNDILTLHENASYNLRSGVTLTRGNIRTNLVSRLLVQLEQFCGETYKTIYKIQIV